MQLAFQKTERARAALKRKRGDAQEFELIQCQDCTKSLPHDHFDPAELALWRRNYNLSRDAVCSTCRTTRDVALIKCQSCTKSLPQEHFDAAELATCRRHGHLSTRAVCSTCRTTTPTHWRDKSVTLSCSLCSKALPLTAFDAAMVKEWRRTDSLAFAKCLVCQPSKDDSVRYACQKCKQSLPLSAFRPQMQKLHGLDRWKCDSCQRPACTVCSERPAEPLVFHVELETYRCQKCLYPPCASCGRARPSKSKRQRENADAKPTWRCVECRAA